jgi:hypothetical protein
MKTPSPVTPRWKRLSLCSATATLLFSSSASAETLLIDQGQAKAEIVVAEDAAPTTKLAAAQLQEHLKTMTGVQLPLVTKPTDATASKIYVGPGPFTEALGVQTRDLQHDAYRMVSGAGWLVLAGRDIPFLQQRGPQAAELLRLAGAKHGPEHDRVWEKWYALSGGKWGLPYSQLWKSYNKELDVWEALDRPEKP